MAVREASCVLGDYLQKMKGICVDKSMGEIFVLGVHSEWFAGPGRGLLGFYHATVQEGRFCQPDT